MASAQPTSSELNNCETDSEPAPSIDPRHLDDQQLLSLLQTAAQPRYGAPQQADSTNPTNPNPPAELSEPLRDYLDKMLASADKACVEDEHLTQQIFGQPHGRKIFMKSASQDTMSSPAPGQLGGPLARRTHSSGGGTLPNILAKSKRAQQPTAVDAPLRLPLDAPTATTRPEAELYLQLGPSSEVPRLEAQLRAGGLIGPRAGRSLPADEPVRIDIGSDDDLPFIDSDSSSNVPPPASSDPGHPTTTAQTVAQHTRLPLTKEGLIDLQDAFPQSRLVYVNPANDSVELRELTAAAHSPSNQAVDDADDDRWRRRSPANNTFPPGNKQRPQRHAGSYNLEDGTGSESSEVHQLMPAANQLAGFPVTNFAGGVRGVYTGGAGGLLTAAAGGGVGRQTSPPSSHYGTNNSLTHRGHRPPNPTALPNAERRRRKAERDKTVKHTITAELIDGHQGHKPIEALLQYVEGDEANKKQAAAAAVTAGGMAGKSLKPKSSPSGNPSPQGLPGPMNTSSGGESSASLPSDEGGGGRARDTSGGDDWQSADDGGADGTTATRSTDTTPSSTNGDEDDDDDVEEEEEVSGDMAGLESEEQVVVGSRVAVAETEPPDTVAARGRRPSGPTLDLSDVRLYAPEDRPGDAATPTPTDEDFTPVQTRKQKKHKLTPRRSYDQQAQHAAGYSPLSGARAGFQSPWAPPPTGKQRSSTPPPVASSQRGLPQRSPMARHAMAATSATADEQERRRRNSADERRNPGGGGGGGGRPASDEAPSTTPQKAPSEPGDAPADRRMLYSAIISGRNRPATATIADYIDAAAGGAPIASPPGQRQRQSPAGVRGASAAAADDSANKRPAYSSARQASSLHASRSTSPSARVGASATNAANASSPDLSAAAAAGRALLHAPPPPAASSDSAASDEGAAGAPKHALPPRAKTWADVVKPMPLGADASTERSEGADDAAAAAAAGEAEADDDQPLLPPRPASVPEIEEEECGVTLDVDLAAPARHAAAASLPPPPSTGRELSLVEEAACEGGADAVEFVAEAAAVETCGGMDISFGWDASLEPAAASEHRSLELEAEEDYNQDEDGEFVLEERLPEKHVVLRGASGQPIAIGLPPDADDDEQPPRLQYHHERIAKSLLLNWQLFQSHGEAPVRYSLPPSDATTAATGSAASPHR